MGGLFQPVNQVKFTNVAIVKYKYKGKKFEIACYKNKIIDWRDGVELNLDDVLQSPLIFTNISKGEVAKKSELFACFNSDDKYEICKTILEKGTLQISNRERNTLKEKMHKDIIEILHGMCVNPQTGYPLSTNMIENMLKTVGYSINIDDSAKRQALKVFDILSKNYDNLISRAFMRIQIICDEFLKSDMVHFLNTHSVIFEESKASNNLKREDNVISKGGEPHGGNGNLGNYKGQDETEKESGSEKYAEEEEEEDEDDDDEKEKNENEEKDILHDNDNVTQFVNDISQINDVDDVGNTNEDDELKKEAQTNESGRSDIALDEDKRSNNSPKQKQEKKPSSIKKEEDISAEQSGDEDYQKKKRKKKKKEEKKDIKHSEKHKIVFLCYPYVYKYIDEYVKKNKKYCSCKILSNNVKMAIMRKEKTDVEHVPSKNFGHDLEGKGEDEKNNANMEKGKGKGKRKGKSKLRGRNDSDDEREQKKKEQEEAQNAAREEQLKKLAEAEIRASAAQKSNAADHTPGQDNSNVACVMMCSSCVMKVPKSEYKGHCRSDFHVYNVKRKYKNLPPVTLEEYKEIDFDITHFRVDT